MQAITCIGNFQMLKRVQLLKNYHVENLFLILKPSLIYWKNKLIVKFQYHNYILTKS